MKIEDLKKIKTVEISAIKISSSADGDYVYVDVEYKGKWIRVHKECVKLGIISNILEARGIVRLAEEQKPVN